MARTINVKIHPNVTIEEIIQHSQWPVPSSMYKENMRKALDFFQRKVDRSTLHRQEDAGLWNLRFNRTKIKLLNWMQGINFLKPVNPQRLVNKGRPGWERQLRRYGK